MASGSDAQTTAEDEETIAKQEPTNSTEEEKQEPESSAEEETRADSAEEGEDSGDEQQGVGTGHSMASAIEDVSGLPGETVSDQDGRKIGQVKEIYAVGEDETPMWVTIESATGLGRSRMVFVPLARIKKQHDEIRVPYSFDHIHDSPEIDPEDEISEEDDRALRTYYAIGAGDQELVSPAQSYASQVPDEEGAARKIDGDAAKGPVREIDDTPPAKLAGDAYEKQKEEEGEEHRHGKGATADDIFEEDGAGGKDDESGEEDSEESEEKGGKDGDG